MVRWFPQYFDRVSLRKAGFSKDYAKKVAREGGEKSAAEAQAGKGRVVVLVAVALEHLVVLACVLVELVIPSMGEGTRVEVQRRCTSATSLVACPSPGPFPYLVA